MFFHVLFLFSSFNIIINHSGRQISAIGSTVFASLVGLIPPLPLMQRLCTIATHDKDRMRCAALKAIAAYLAKSDTPLDTHLLQRLVLC
jgi:hypothetical protein